MKKRYLILVSALLLTSCNWKFWEDWFGTSSDSESKTDTATNTETDSIVPPSLKENLYGEDYSLCENLSTKSNNGAEYLDFDYYTETVDDITVRYAEKYVNNVKSSLDSRATTNDDVKMIFYTDNEARFTSLPDGYVVSVPTNTTLGTDFSIGEYRSKIYNEEFTLTVSYEHSNPYGSGNGNIGGWATYRDEWLLEYLQKDKWYTANNLALTRKKKFENTSIKDGYSICQYDIEIKDPGNIDKPFYNIAVIRDTYKYKEFYLLVMKSIKNNDEVFDKIIQSFVVTGKIGKASNKAMYNLPIVKNENWNAKTLNYYNKLLDQEYTEWGWYNGNLPVFKADGANTDGDMNSFAKDQNKYITEYDYNFGLVSSYCHVSYGNSFAAHRFPMTAAKQYCGDGFDGKPVIQFNYQFTDNNNNLAGSGASEKSPMFDILRGHDGNTIDFFNYRNQAYNSLVRLADNIKEYGNPVLFRLNNEMNTDWTSYCGMINLLDPDLFQASWRLLYNIFEERGANNVIFIFNPIATSCPYSSWGEDLCYFPGAKYVNVLGLTSYQFNNNNEGSTNTGTFESLYTTLYYKNNPVWNKYPWIISEFACGSGGMTTGELYRYGDTQATWVGNMFNALNSPNRPDYVKNIKGAVWFSVNDYENTSISNALNIPLSEAKMRGTISAFKTGFNTLKLLKEKLK